MTHKMLIVDDSPAFREMFKELLIRSGFDKILEASDYDEAISLFNKERPDMIFVDMILPGKSGVDITRDILRIDPGAVIIAISSIINKKLIKEALTAGAKDFLFKPTNELALEKVIQMWGKDHT
ncbi:MAG: response regulator [Thermoplasmata archaeon]